MAKYNIIAEYIRTDLPHETKLRIYENKQGLRGTLLNSYGKKISTAMFYSKDRDNTVYRVMEYYGFTNNNSYAILTDGSINEK